MSLILYRSQVMPILVRVSDSTLILKVQIPSSYPVFWLTFQDIGNFDAVVNWGDGSPTFRFTTYDDERLYHTYDTGGEYEILITGSIPNFYSIGWSYTDKIIEVTHTGDSFIALDYGFDEGESILAFNSLSTSEVTNFTSSFEFCMAITSFPVIDTSKGIEFDNTWRNCNKLTSFPLIDVSKSTTFVSTWENCTGLLSFPLLNVNKGTTFYYAWYNCTSLVDFPAGMFDTWTATPGSNCFLYAWDNCTSLSTQSVENILVSIKNSGKSAPSSGKEITIDYNVATGGLTSNTTTAITTLKSKGWTIRINGVLR